MESKVNDYQLRQGDRIYVFSTSIVENLIRLSCKNHSGKSYSRDFTVYDINTIDPIFSEIETESDAIKFIDKALGKYKVGVIEESGVIKIIFYIQAKGLIHSAEIPLGESGKSLLQSKIDNLNIDNNAFPTTTQFDETGQPIEIAPQNYENSSYSIGNMNSYGQQSFYSPPIITPIEGEISNDSNYNFNQYMSQSQYQTNGGNGFYGDTSQFETGAGFTGTNLENLGSFIQQNNSQYIQYDSTNDFSGALMSPNDYNSNTYEYPSNQYTTSNNYFSTNYDTSYQATNTSYDANSYNYPTTYSNTTNQYYQSAIEETAYNGQEFQTYETTASVTSLNNNNILPTTAQSEPLDTNKYNESNQHENDTNQVESSDKGANVVSNSQNEQGIQEETAISTKITDANDNKKSLQQTSTSAAQSNIKSSPNLQTQKSVSPQININESELQKLKEEAAQATVLREQLNRLEPLKKQVEEMGELKKQILELNSLREKAIELNMVKSQLGELKELRQQVGQMNILRQQLDELDSLRSQVALTESLKKRVEELEKINLEYEQEIKELRESQRQRESVNAKSNSNIMSTDENKQITLEEKTEQVCVKGEIIHDTNELEMLTKKINKLNKKLTLNLLYKASADSDKAAAFHAKCDQANSTIVLIETDKGKRFGGYTTCSWSGECVDKKDENAFVFSLDKMKTYDNIPGEDAIGCYPKFGPIFLGCQIRIYNNAFSKGGTTFERGLNYNTEEDFELTGGDRVFNVKEIEVYEVIPQ